MNWPVVLVTIAGCGRVGFDVHDAAGDSAATAPPITFIQHADTQVAGMAAMATTNQPITAGDLVLVGVSYDTAAPQVVTLSDSLGMSFHEISSPVAARYVSHLYATTATTGGIDTITASIPIAPTSYLQLRLWEYQGATVIDDVAQANGVSSTPDSIATPPLAASLSYEVVFGWGELSTVLYQPGTGFTEVDSFQGDPAEDRVVSAPGAYTATMSPDPNGTQWTIVGATLR